MGKIIKESKNLADLVETYLLIMEEKIDELHKMTFLDQLEDAAAIGRKAAMNIWHYFNSQA